MNITLRIGDGLVAGELYDNPVAEQIMTLLPFEAGFDDFHDQEKVAPLGRSLRLDGVPRADAPEPTSRRGTRATSGSRTSWRTR